MEGNDSSSNSNKIVLNYNFKSNNSYYYFYYNNNFYYNKHSNLLSLKSLENQHFQIITLQDDRIEDEKANNSNNCNYNTNINIKIRYNSNTLISRTTITTPAKAVVKLATSPDDNKINDKKIAGTRAAATAQQMSATATATSKQLSTFKMQQQEDGLKVLAALLLYFSSFTFH